MSIGAVMELREHRLIGEERARASMARTLDVMREETSAPLANPTPSLGGFLGGEAQRVATASEKTRLSLLGEVQTAATAKAMAVLERSASMGVIVAAPTAGSSGIVPGCVLALAEHLDASDETIIEALFCAAAIGLNLTTSACVAGAEGGCQAEVGSAAAMAAAALVQMMGGHARAGTPCLLFGTLQPLGPRMRPVWVGLVEVPCQTRNAIGVAAAFSSAQLALSGIASLVPFDEMAKVMLSVGHALPASLRETARGGIAQAPSALSACARCGICA